MLLLAVKQHILKATAGQFVMASTCDKLPPCEDGSKFHRKRQELGHTEQQSADEQRGKPTVDW